LKDYQLEAVNWLIGLHEAGINGILADEMGLGKTIEVIGFLGYLREYKKIERPFLVVSPKSVLSNWCREFKKWCSVIQVVKLKATKEEREATLRDDLLADKFDVCITTYQGLNKCVASLKRFDWEYVVIDEAHSIKNEMSLLAENVRKLNHKHIMLLTGTPLQNSLHELWSLLNCLLPDLFESATEFDEWFNFDKKPEEGVSEDKQAEYNIQLAHKLRRILRPFLLRRTKTEVEKSIPPKKEIYITVGMTELQRKMYKELLLKSMLQDDDHYYHNTLMQLRKVCDHPYLFPNVEPKDAPVYGDHIITASGKLRILNKLLDRTLKKKSKAILFSQMTKVLDILEDYLVFRGIHYCRIDGETSYEERERQMDLFNDPESYEVPVFLLTTRAGGLGISLTGADTVIIFDSDFNPQVDLQAMDRAHRIGQTKPVTVYRLVAQHTIEEKIVERQAVRLKLESIVIKNAAKVPGKGESFSKDELKEMLQFGADQILEGCDDLMESEADIEALIAKGEQRAKEMSKQVEEKIKAQYNMADFSLNTLNLYEFENEDYRQKKRQEEKKALNQALTVYLEEQSRRDREKPVESYNEEAAYRMMLGNPEPAKKPRPPKINPYHLYPTPERLQELLLKEKLAKQKQQRKPLHKEAAGTGPGPGTGAEAEKAGTNGLTPEEQQEKDAILAKGFNNWTKSEVDELIQCMKDYGVTAYEQMKGKIESKSLEEIQRYAQALWQSILTIPNGPSTQKAIERKQKERDNMKRIEVLIGRKIMAYENPRKEMTFKYVKYERENQYSRAEDSALMYFTHKNKYGNWSGIRFDILHDIPLRFNYFLKTRNNEELKKRIDYLVKNVEREVPSSASSSSKKTRSRSPAIRFSRPKTWTTSAITTPKDTNAPPSHPLIPQPQPQLQPLQPIPALLPSPTSRNRSSTRSPPSSPSHPRRPLLPRFQLRMRVRVPAQPQLPDPGIRSPLRLRLPQSQAQAQAQAQFQARARC
jgi:SWI/SNF-related matrix-associated actin-dependent regulator of chromatin subfamily A member 5